MTTITKETLQKLMLKDNDTILDNAFYIFEKNRLCSNVNNIYDIFKNIGLNLRQAYSFKTNSSDEVLSAVKDLGMRIEVVSPDEFNKALDIGFTLDNIVYNGVIEDAKNKFLVASNGGVVNIENKPELEKILKYAEEKDELVLLGLRINLEISGERNSRFGFCVGPDTDELEEAIEMIMNSRCGILSGFHLHTHGHRELNYFKEKIEKLVKLSKYYDVPYIDIGSGIYGYMHPYLKRQFGDKIPQVKDYADIMRDIIYDVYKEYYTKLVIISEFGTPIISDTFSLICKVTNIRKIGNRNIATVNASQYDMGFLPLTKKVPMNVIPNFCCEEVFKNVDICGNSCVQGDYLFRGYKGRLSVGDNLIFFNLGSYSVSMKSDFINKPLKIYVI